MDQIGFLGTQYVPFLKAKAGEADALARIPGLLRSGIMPFFDIPRTPESSGQSIDQQIEKSVKQIDRAMGETRRLFLDVFDIPNEVRCASGAHPLAYGLSLLAERGFLPVPVYGFDRDAEHLNVAADFARASGAGIALRLDDYDISIPEKLADDVASFCGATGNVSRSTDLIIDFRSLLTVDTASARSKALEAIRSLLEIGRFRQIVLAGSNYPKDVSPVSRDSVGYLPRTEFQIWRDVSRALKKRAFVKFGDYGVVHPDFVDRGPVPNANAKIRYTIDDQWMIARGHQLSQPPFFDQYHELAGRILDSGKFCGQMFSFGDSHLAMCARRACGPGNLRTWIGVDTNHHIHYVSNQVIGYVKTEKLPLYATR